MSNAYESSDSNAGTMDPNSGQNPQVFARDLLVALLRFKTGTSPHASPRTSRGIDGKIADVFNDILGVSARRAQEIGRVCRVVGKEGKLKQRMNVPGAIGGWADEVVSLNTLIDDLVWPTTEVTRAIGAVAKGDLAQTMGWMSMVARSRGSF